MSQDPLEENFGDKLAEYAKETAPIVLGFSALASGYWWVPILAGLIKVSIPQRRNERIVDMLHRMDARMRQLEVQVRKERLESDAFLDLMANGVFQATQAANADRRQHIANLLVHSLTTEEMEAESHQRMLHLLGQLNDIEVILLQYYSFSYSNSPEAVAFYDQHQDVIRVPSAVLGSSDEEVDQQALSLSYRDHLINLGLIKQTFKKPKKNELPEFDYKSGRIKARGRSITRLGGVLLDFINAQPVDAQSMDPPLTEE